MKTPDVPDIYVGMICEYTPEEIKKGLAVCHITWKKDHFVDCDKTCPFLKEGLDCRLVLHNHGAAKMIKHLESRLAQVELERDAAVNDMVQIVHEVDDIACKWCKNAYFDEVKCKECRFHNESFEWQGVQPTNTKEE